MTTAKPSDQPVTPEHIMQVGLGFLERQDGTYTNTPSTGDPLPHADLLMSLNMLVETPGGFDYTGADCRGWMNECGFRSSRVEHLVGPASMVVGVK